MARQLRHGQSRSLGDARGHRDDRSHRAHPDRGGPAPLQEQARGGQTHRPAGARPGHADVSTRPQMRDHEDRTPAGEEPQRSSNAPTREEQREQATAYVNFTEVAAATNPGHQRPAGPALRPTPTRRSGPGRSPGRRHGRPAHRRRRPEGLSVHSTSTRPAFSSSTSRRNTTAPAATRRQPRPARRARRAAGVACR